MQLRDQDPIRYLHLGPHVRSLGHTRFAAPRVRQGRLLKPSSGRDLFRASEPVKIFLAVSLLLVLIRWPFQWTGNEEHYFLLAHRLVAPDQYSALHAAFDQSRGRIFGFAVFGVTVEMVGFEAAHWLLGLLSVFAIAVGFASVAQMLRLRIHGAFMVLLLFLAAKQSIAGGEWFIGGVETKAFAYAAGMAALSTAHARKVRITAFLIAISSYLHFQVGAFWLTATIVFMLADRQPSYVLRQLGAIIVILLWPLVIILGFDVMNSLKAAQPQGIPHSDVIYSLLRAPHHTAPFAREFGWASDAIWAGYCGLAVSFTSFALTRQAKGEAILPLLVTVGVLALALPTAVVLSWFDRDTGSLGKFYLFRPATPVLLLALFALAALITHAVPRCTRQLVFGFAIFGAMLELATSHSRWPWPATAKDWAPVAAVVGHTTSGDEAVLIDPDLDAVAVHLPRILRRPTVVSWKFVPTNARDLYRWHQLIEWQRRLYERGCPSAGSAVGALIVHPKNVNEKKACGRLVYLDDTSAIIDVKPEGQR